MYITLAELLQYTLVGIINRNDDAFAYKVLVRTINLEKVLHN